jgi:hypothetical protein
MRLNELDAGVRASALAEAVAEGGFPEQERWLNLHCHTFFSYNGYGYSPSYLAWRARREGLGAVGIVDFDVLDAVDEFRAACAAVGIKGCAGLETRVFIPEFADREINSPGEPGISYHMGVGFTQSAVNDAAFLGAMKASAQQRNLGIVERVNPFLAPVVLDYEADVLPLTPAGNATERHLCEAYERKGVAVFPDAEARAAFWAEKLGADVDTVRGLLDDSPGFQALLRSKTMKAGGVGYVKPEGPDFPRLADVNAFVMAEGAIPTLAWLDGTTAGEQAMEEMLDLQMGLGTAAVNIIPDRNWNIADPAVKAAKVANLNAFIAMAQARHLPILVGTEMNAYGQKFVDDFDAPELAPHLDAFVDGAHIIYGHTVLQAAAGMGYLSDWAAGSFDTTAEKNDFYSEVGERGAPNVTDTLESLSTADAPAAVLARLR